MPSRLRRALQRVALASLLALPPLASVAAQEPRPPASRAEIAFSYSSIAKKTAPAVVNVYASRSGRREGSPLDDPLFRRFFGFDPRMPRERMQTSLGSGVIVRPDGIVVTNNHVIANGDDVKVALADRREFEAEVVLKDERSDLAVLRIKAGHESFPFLPLGDSDALEVGDLVLAVGNPFNVGQTVTSGIVSALARTINPGGEPARAQGGGLDNQFFIQTDAAINPGNSGGALVDMAGRLIGINTAIYSRTGGSHGIGFAIPSNLVQFVVDSALAGGIRRPWLGAVLQDITPEIAGSLSLPRPVGALIARIADSGVAKEAGLKVGDVILAVDGQEVPDQHGFSYRFATRKLGSKVSLTVFRQGHEIVVPVTVKTAPETTPRDEKVIRNPSPLAGATVVNLSPATAEELGLDPHLKGVVVANVSGRSAAESNGLQKGDLILGVNNDKVETTRDVERLTGRRDSVRRLVIKRGDQVLMFGS